MCPHVPEPPAHGKEPLGVAASTRRVKFTPEISGGVGCGLLGCESL